MAEKMKRYVYWPGDKRYLVFDLKYSATDWIAACQDVKDAERIVAAMNYWEDRK